jgi:hypothetical protein
MTSVIRWGYLSDESTNETETYTRESESLKLFLAPPNATFVRHRKRYIPVKRRKLRNSLLVGAGFLELANVGSFVANVWNSVSVPVYAVVLMVVGGTLALFISCFAFRDV